MQQHILIVGAGVIGAAVAHQVSRHARVTVIAGAEPRATDASFGWINASYFLDEGHFRLRRDAIGAFARLMAEVEIPVQVQSSLCWETSGAAFDTQYKQLKRLGSDVQIVDGAYFASLEPHVATVPERALLFPDEAVASSGELVDYFLSLAQARGACIVNGVSVEAINQSHGRVNGVRTNVGNLLADQVLIAAGTGTEPLMATIDIDVPMLRRPGAMVRTRPVAPMLKHVLASADQEVRQLSNGALLAPAAASHQSDDGERLPASPGVLADKTLTRLREMFPQVALACDSLMIADRPMPRDGLPVVGRIGPEGLYVATMHSGITLAALMGELVSDELLHGINDKTARDLAPYRPQRFAK